MIVTCSVQTANLTMNTRKSRDISIIQEIGLWPALFFQLESHRIFLLRLLIAIGVLLFTVGVSLVFSLKDPLYGAILAALPFGVAFFFIVQSRLYLAPVLILLAAAYIPFSLPTGTGSRLVISLIFAVGFLFLWWFRMAVIEKDFRLVWTYANWPVFGFVATTLISFAWSVIFRDPLALCPQFLYFCAECFCNDHGCFTFAAVAGG